MTVVDYVVLTIVGLSILLSVIRGLVREALALRVARGVNHALATLMAGITTVRDLGSEGAAYADVGLRDAIAQGIVPGPRMLVAGPAMVVTGWYAPKGFAPEVLVPQGAEEADGPDGVVRVARGQIARGVDFIKIYADYRWGPNGEARPGFTLEEIKELLDLDSGSDRVRARELAEQRLADLSVRIAELQRARSALTVLARECSADDDGPCPILEAFEQ